MLKLMNHLLCAGGLFAAGSSLAAPANNVLDLDYNHSLAMIDVLTKFYHVPATTVGELSYTLATDAVRCDWTGSADSSPLCSVTVAGHALGASAPTTVLPGSTLFQILADYGVVKAASGGKPGYRVEARSLRCEWSTFALPTYTCHADADRSSPATMPGAQVTAAGTVAFTTSQAMTAFDDNKPTDQERVFSLDAVSCAIPYSFYTKPSCTLTKQGHTTSVADDQASAFYLLIVEAGGAVFNPSDSSYAATALNVRCVNHYYSPESDTCSLTIPTRHPVPTIPGEGDVYSNDANLLIETLLALGVPKEVDHDGGFAMRDLTLSCANSSPSALSKLSCELTGKGVKVATTPDNAFQFDDLYSTTAVTGSARLNQGTLIGSQTLTTGIWCSRFAGNGFCRTTPYLSLPH